VLRACPEVRFAIEAGGLARAQAQLAARRGDLDHAFADQHGDGIAPADHLKDGADVGDGDRACLHPEGTGGIVAHAQQGPPFGQLHHAGIAFHFDLEAGLRVERERGAFGQRDLPHLADVGGVAFRAGGIEQQARDARRDQGATSGHAGAMPCQPADGALRSGGGVSGSASGTS
jgi:hypothetical protein